MRLLTRADLDGIVCAALIMEKEGIAEIVFAHPKDMEDGKVEVIKGDVITNLPFHPNAAMWFDHHHKAEETESLPAGVKGKVGVAKSTARLVYDYYQGSFKPELEEMLSSTDKLDSAILTMQDVLQPDKWILLGYTLDPRTGLGGFKEYSLEIIKAIQQGLSIENILVLDSVKERTEKYFKDEIAFEQELKSCTRMDNNVSITDFRKVEKMPSGNRFVVFALFPDCDINVRIYRHKDPMLTMCSVGKSIFKRNHPVHVGKLMAEFGGGGLPGAGTCPLQADTADAQIAKIIERLIIK